ncbi:hypothetical protein QTO01_11195 [Vibrio mytili]|uniref:hypothetical protein n=1 Tax=Vibrio mytili TaxID=50718 RepID=UPI002F40D229
MAELVQNITTIRGDTVFSPVWCVTNEDLPAGITEEEFYQGVQNGQFTLIDLTQFEIRAHVRQQYNSAIIYDLTSFLEIQSGYIRFILPASETEVLANERQTLIYDIEFTEINTGYVKTVIKGSLNINQDVTYDDVQPAPPTSRMV